MPSLSLICSNCGAFSLVDWEDLTLDQKMIVKRLPGSANFSDKEREKHKFCTRCWFEDTNRSSKTV